MLDFYTNLTFQQHREKKMFYEKKPILIRVHILYMHKSCQKWNSKGILQHNTNETQKKKLSAMKTSKLSIVEKQWQKKMIDFIIESIKSIIGQYCLFAIT